MSTNSCRFRYSKFIEHSTQFPYIDFFIPNADGGEPRRNMAVVSHFASTLFFSRPPSRS